MPTPLIFTFYSFRGGVGRSMALLNAGWILAKTGSRVLLIDFDLEAPGLTQLIHKADLVIEPRDACSGVAELIAQFLQSSREGPPREDKGLSLDLDRSLIELKIPDPPLTAIPRGRCRVMAAGAPKDYARLLLDTRSSAFARRRESFARSFRSALLQSEQFDYILIDARTGLSDEAYITCRYMCDHLIVLSGLNDQNIEGTRIFIGNVADWKKRQEGPKSTLLVASPVPEYQEDLVEERLKEVMERLRDAGGGKLRCDLQLPYHPRLSLDVELIARLWPQSGLGRAYHRLANILRRAAEDTYGDWAERASEAINGRDPQKALAAARRAAAIDLDETRRLLRFIAASVRQYAGEDAAKFLEVFPGLAELDPTEPLYPLEHGRFAARLKRPRTEVTEAFQKAERLARDGAIVPALAATLAGRADYLYGLDSWEPAVQDALGAAEAFTKIRDIESASEALMVAARAGRELGRTVFSRECLEKVRDSAARLSEPRARKRLSLALWELADLEEDQGRYAEARRGFGESLAIDRELDDRRGIAVTLASLARLDYIAGRYAEARRGFEESLALNREVRDRRGIAVLLTGLADLDATEGRYVEARHGFRESLAMMRELGDRRGIASVLDSLAELDRLEGRYIEARRGSEESLAMMRELGDRRGTAAALYLLGEVDRFLGRYAEARRGFEESLAMHRELGDRAGMSVRLGALAVLDRLEGRYAEALRGFEESLAMDRELGHPREVALTELNLQATRALDAPGAPLDPLRKAFAVARECVDPSVRVRASFLLGQVLRMRGAFSEARIVLTEGARFADDHGLRGLAAEVRAEFALCLADSGQPAEAAVAAREELAFFQEQGVAHPDEGRLRQIAGPPDPSTPSPPRSA